MLFCSMLSCSLKPRLDRMFDLVSLDLLSQLLFLLYNNCNTYSSSYHVCNGTQPPHISILHFRNVVYARSLSEMCAARHDVVQVACGCAAHTVFAVPIAPQLFRCRGGGLSQAHSVGCPPCTPRQRVTTRESFFWVDVVPL